MAPSERAGANSRRPIELRVRFLLKSKKSRRSAELYWPNDGNFSESTAWGDDVVLVLATNITSTSSSYLLPSCLALLHILREKVKVFMYVLYLLGLYVWYVC